MFQTNRFGLMYEGTLGTDIFKEPCDIMLIIWRLYNINKLFTLDKLTIAMERGRNLTNWSYVLYIVKNNEQHQIFSQ